MTITKRSLLWELLQSWWMLFLFTLGIGNWVAFLFIGAKVQQKKWLWWSFIYALPLIVSILTLLFRPNSSYGYLNVLALFLVAIISFIHGILARKEYLIKLAAILDNNKEDINKEEKEENDPLRTVKKLVDSSVISQKEANRKPPDIRTNTNTDNVRSTLEKRLVFYEQAYYDRKKRLDIVIEENVKKEDSLKKYCYNLVEGLLGKDIDETEREFIHKNFGVNILDYDQKYQEQLRSERIKTVELLKADVRYKEYLNLIIDEDLNMVLDLEKNEAFNYLIEEKFHTDEFRNDPYINLVIFKYQPRYWKFAKVANRIAKSQGFSDYRQMFEIWQKLRCRFLSLSNDQKITDVVAQGQEIEKIIKELEFKIENISVECATQIKDRLVEVLLSAPDSKFAHFHQEEARLILRLRADLISAKKKEESLNEQLSKILPNISCVEKILTAQNLSLNETQLALISNTQDPTVQIFELIPSKEWKEIARSFAKIGIDVGDKSDYTRVRTKLDKKTEEWYHRKYGVKEGEIFIDENLVGK